MAQATTGYKTYLNDGATTEAADHFKLNPDFINKYKGKKPKFGFNGLGEFVFYRTYSRIKKDGTKETFLDMAIRVIEGCYEIQRLHCKRFHIPYDLKKAQRSAQEMFQRMWDFKFLPPGRGLWMMGTDFMWEKGSASLNNCFDGKTEIITRDGIKPIGQLSGTEQELLTTNGKWVKSPIKSFGKQELYKLILERSGVQKVIYTTANHRWFAKDRGKTTTINTDCNGVVTKKRVNLGYREMTTTELTTKHSLQSVYGQGILGNVRPSPFGISHGIVYGDGTTGSDSESCGSYIYLCGAKNEELLEYFANCPTTNDPNKGREGAIRVADLPRFFRRPPSLRESKSYLYGWLAGYFAAGGTINKKGNQICIASSDQANMLLVRDVCAILGIGTNAIVSTTQTVRHKGKVKKFVGYKIGLAASHLRPEFFLLSEHRQRFESHDSHRERPIYNWRVKSVEATGEIAEVFCAQVPDTMAFALADNILTGNCAFVSTDDKIEADPAEPFCFLMDMSLLGVGVGFDTKGAGKVKIFKPADAIIKHIISDSREGWVDSVRKLIHSYTLNVDHGVIEFDYSEIRPAGSAIKGFGGKAAGPGILVELHDLIRNHLERRVGGTLSSVDITDIMNYIGRCIVAGNVRRCLPKGTLVHLKRGLVPIETVQVGDLVLTAAGYHPVSENVMQGVQNVITINSQMGSFRCTERHRIAVMNGLGSYEWKRANQLKANDRMVFVDETLPGTQTVMPEYSDFSTRGKKLIIPSLSPSVAWFIGAIQGDGYVYIGREYKGRKHHGASISIAINRDEYYSGIESKIIAGFDSFGFDEPCYQPTQDNCSKIRVASRKLATYFYRHIKKPKTSLQVPDFIRLAVPEIRAAYLAGLLDTDGSTKNRPTTLISSVYRDFIRQVQAVYSSLGIPTKVKLRKNTNGNTQALWDLNLVGDFAINKFANIVQPHAVKCLRDHGHSSGHDFGYPSEWIDREEVDYGKKWSSQQEQMTYQRALLCEAQTNNLIPVRIESIVDEGIALETYDLSVPNRNEFVAEGLLVHNTAEIAFGAADDPAYCSMKNATATLLPDEIGKFYECTGKIYQSMRNVATPEDFNGSGIPEERLLPAIETWNALNHHRWASNNSVFADVGMNYEDIGQQIAVNGEPGLIWLDNIRDYGRMIDGRQPGIDGRVMGTNPCVEQSLESYELCCLVETFPANHDDVDDYMRTLKFAYLYAKTVTLLPTHNARTNQVMLRNRRIGLSQSGIIQAFAKFGRRKVLKEFCDAGYQEIKRWDTIYADWLCIQKSIKVTSVKPSGSVSLLAGATPGIHYPEASTYWRTVRVAKDSTLVKILSDAGYRIEPAITDKDRTVVVYFGVTDERVKSIDDASIWQQMVNAIDYQRYWADNQVSCTVKFKTNEVNEISKVLGAFEDQMKGISFLPHTGHNYPQAPYTPCTKAEVDEYNATLKDADYSEFIYEAAGSKFCDGDSCETNLGT